MLLDMLLLLSTQYLNANSNKRKCTLTPSSVRSLLFQLMVTGPFYLSAELLE